uniref:Uncharacterized protein n=1 Tax=Oryza barthii TaxID=65489 RepID=A0A0D3HM84_9ORYZ
MAWRGEGAAHLAAAPRPTYTDPAVVVCVRRGCRRLDSGSRDGATAGDSRGGGGSGRRSAPHAHGGDLTTASSNTEGHGGAAANTSMMLRR